MEEASKKKESTIEVNINRVIVPMMSAIMTNAIYSNKLFHRQQGTPRTENEIMEEVFDTYHSLLMKFTEEVVDNLGVSIYTRVEM